MLADKQKGPKSFAVMLEEVQHAFAELLLCLEASHRLAPGNIPKIRHASAG